jgi:hypothetical protein
MSVSEIILGVLIAVALWCVAWLLGGGLDP